MKHTLKTLALCAGILALGLPAHAQTAAPTHANPPSAVPIQLDPHFLKQPDPSQGAIGAAPAGATAVPSYDQVKSAFAGLADGIKTALNGPQTTKLISDLQSQIDGLSALQQQYVADKEKAGVQQSELDGIVAKYVAQVKLIQQSYAQLTHEQQSMVQVVNYGLTALQSVDAQKAQADADVKATIEGLQKRIDAKFAAPIEAAEKAVGPVLKATETAIEARMPTILNEELTRAVSNQLESAAAQ